MTLQRVAVVTGASSGLGLAVARGLARTGFQVLGPPRAALDVASPQSVRGWASSCHKPELLVCCAGVCGPGQHAWQVNFEGHKLLFELLNPRRCVFVGSNAMYRAFGGVLRPDRTGFNVYAASKLALNSLASVYRNAGYQVSCVRPPAFDSNIWPPSIRWLTRRCLPSAEDAAKVVLEACK